MGKVQRKIGSIVTPAWPSFYELLSRDSVPYRLQNREWLVEEVLCGFRYRKVALNEPL